LGDFLKELDLTEGKATGIPTIIKAMEKNVSPKPEFDTDEDRSFFHVIVPVHDAFLVSTKVRRKKNSSSEKTVELPFISSEKIIEEFGENSFNILLAIREDVTISASDIAQKILLSSRGVEKNIAKLKAAGFLKRIGPDKGGEWKLLVRINNK
jgi:ATP-dependent DNA helicase RecG